MLKITHPTFTTWPPYLTLFTVVCNQYLDRIKGCENVVLYGIF
jgi:hypothetical protein